MAPPLKGGPLPFARAVHTPVEKKIFVGLIFFCSFDQPFSILSIFNFFLNVEKFNFYWFSFSGMAWLQKIYFGTKNKYFFKKYWL